MVELYKDKNMENQNLSEEEEMGKLENPDISCVENQICELNPGPQCTRYLVKTWLTQMKKDERCGKILEKRSNHLKYSIKSKSLDLFDRPSRKLHLTRFRSLSTMSSIPENSSCSSWMQGVRKEDDMVVGHRSPVSIDNGYRPTSGSGMK